MLVELLEDPLELLLSLENVRVIGVDILSVLCIAIDGLSSFTNLAASVFDRLMRQSTLSLDQVHLLLQLLLVVEGNLVSIPFLLRAEAPEVCMLVDLFGLFVRLSGSIAGWSMRQEAIPGKRAVGTFRWNGTDREPVVGAVDIHREMPLDSLPFLHLHGADVLEVFASEIFMGRLHDQPPFRLALKALVPKFNVNLHT